MRSDGGTVATKRGARCAHKEVDFAAPCAFLGAGATKWVFTPRRGAAGRQPRGDAAAVRRLTADGTGAAHPQKWQCNHAEGGKGERGG